MPVSGSGLAPSALNTHSGAPAAHGSLGGHYHGQQETELVAQSLPRPVINSLIQVLGQRPASGTNISDIDGDESGDVLNLNVKDRLTGNGQSKAG